MKNYQSVLKTNLLFKAFAVFGLIVFLTSAATKSSSDSEIIMKLSQDLEVMNKEVASLKVEAEDCASLDPFMGEIIMFGGNFAPRGWALCDGQLLPISQHSALFSILGTTYGGDGRTTFALPDLRGRSAVHAGRGPGLSDIRLGQKYGSEFVNVIVDVNSASAGSINVVTKEVLESIIPANNDVKSIKTTVVSGVTGGGGSAPTVTARQSSIVSPRGAVNYIIALQGTFPSRS